MQWVSNTPRENGMVVILAIRPYCFEQCYIFFGYFNLVLYECSLYDCLNDYFNFDWNHFINWLNNIELNGWNLNYSTIIYWMILHIHTHSWILKLHYNYWSYDDYYYANTQHSWESCAYRLYIDLQRIKRSNLCIWSHS